MVTHHDAAPLLPPDQTQLADPGPGTDAVGPQAPVPLWADLHLGGRLAELHRAHVSAAGVGEIGVDGAIAISDHKMAAKPFDLAAAAIKANERALPNTGVAGEQGLSFAHRSAPLKAACVADRPESRRYWPLLPDSWRAVATVLSCWMC